MKGYDTADYAATRLVETHIMYKGQLARVVSCAQFGGQIVIGYELVTGGVGNAFLPEFDLNPPKLGYVNHSGVAYYMTRMPMRKDWKQGMRNSNIIANTGLNPGINMKKINETIMGKFPSISTCLAGIQAGKFKSIAFDRNFCIWSDLKIEYKGAAIVGTVNADGAIKIDDKSNWVREALMEVVGEVA